MSKQTKKHIFTGNEAAMAYALSAERIFSNDYNFLSNNPPAVPIFVSLLFQSLEISIKHAGIASGLFTENEARGSAMRSGHGIEELAALAVKKLWIAELQADHCADKSDLTGTGLKRDADHEKTFEPVVMAMTHFNTEQNSKEIIRSMICGSEFEKTRMCYASRCLGYAQIANGDFAIVADISGWIAAIKETASNLPQIIDILSQWKASTSKSNGFVIWVHGM